VEVYAAGVERRRGPFYRGCLVTRELRGGKDLWSALQDPAMDPARLRAVLKSAADTIGAMHRQGVYHADLNLKNVLVRCDQENAESYVIDFDRAKLFLGRLPAPLARHNLQRLLRSARKLDPQGRHFSTGAWNQFLDDYHAAA
jgi:3-deoxy-D-manno-octulosonic acid kinase